MIIERTIKRLRNYRRYHRIIGLSLALFLVISAVTGILLSFKKEVDWIQPPTQKGLSQQLQDWKSVDELAQIGQTAFYTAYPDQQGNGIDRMDIRPGKGIVKILFEEGWWEVQVDGSSGEVLSIAKRHSDWIEALHDGSIIGNTFKLISMNYIGWTLLLMIITGLWLYFGPKRVRRLKRNSAKHRLPTKHM